MTVAPRVEQLHIDMHRSANLLHAAFEHGRYAQLFGHDFQIRRTAGVLLGRAARDHLEVANTSQPRQDFVLHSSGEVSVVGIAT